MARQRRGRAGDPGSTPEVQPATDDSPDEPPGVEDAAQPEAEPEAASEDGQSSAGHQVGFVLAGVQKAGTSTLFAMLSAHPQIARGKAKELHFFSSNKLDWKSPDYRTYEGQIRWKPQSVIAGEATPSYISMPAAMQRLHDYNPDVRVIVSFRDPIERAFSAWCMLKQRDGSRPDFGQVVRAATTTRKSSPQDKIGRVMNSIVSKGWYGRQLEHTLNVFDREQLLLLNYHGVFVDLSASLARLTDFLGVDRFADAPPDDRVREMPQALIGVPPSAADIAELADLYAADQQRFAELVGFDISSWPSSRVVRGDLDPAELAETLTLRAGLRAPGTVEETDAAPEPPTEAGVDPNLAVGETAEQPSEIEPAANGEGAAAGAGNVKRAERRARRRQVRSRRRSDQDG